ncbi:MAG TPA: ATP-binding protein [Bradyrhizobium sp.]|nr:ATP-binding protein [Bradyrhizobium sp.]
MSRPRGEATETVRASGITASPERLDHRIPAMLHSIDHTGRLQDVTDHWLTVMGYTREAVIGRFVGDFLTPDSARRAVEEVWPAFFKTGHCTDTPYQFVKHCGEVIDVLLTANAMRATDGHILRSIAVMVDVTRRNKAEAALKAAEEQARLAHARLTDAIDSLWEGFLLWDKDDRLVVINRAAFEPLVSPGSIPEVGTTYPEAMGRVVSNGDIVEVINCTEDPATIASKKQREADGTPVEYLLKSGRYISIRRQRTSEGGIVAIWSDITDWKRHEADLIEARQAAESANQAKSAFLSTMSHELRTPLNAILGFGQMLAGDPCLTGKQRGYSEYILTAGRDLLKLIEDILDYSDLKAGRLRFSMRPVAADEALQRVADEMSIVAETAGIALDIDHAVDAIDVLADPARLNQILLNLVSNAIKYNQPGGHVRLAASRMAEGKVRFTVSDAGRGIAPDQQHLVFKSFERLGFEGSTIPGTGLGLAITKHLTEEMSGTIGFTSDLSTGTTFWVEFPAADPQTADRPPSLPCSLTRAEVRPRF